MMNKDDPAEHLRAFNEVYGQVLREQEAALARGGLQPSEWRLLAALADGPAGARALARRLALDEGYVSRLIRRCEDAGLMGTETDPDDRRRQVLTLTRAGGERLDRVTGQARALAAAQLAGAGVGAGRDIDGVTDGLRALTGGIRDLPVSFGPLQPGDGGWVVGQHGRMYASDEGAAAAFEADVAGIVADFLRRGDSDREAGWIVRAGSWRLGSVFVMRTDVAETARLRLFLVRPEARRLGLGAGLIDKCLSFARAAGYGRVILWTPKELRAACRRYAAAGFHLSERRIARVHGRECEEQKWEIVLDPGLAKVASRG